MPPLTAIADTLDDWCVGELSLEDMWNGAGGFDLPVFDLPVFDLPVFDLPVFDLPVFDWLGLDGASRDWQLIGPLLSSVPLPVINAVQQVIAALPAGVLDQVFISYLDVLAQAPEILLGVSATLAKLPALNFDHPLTIDRGTHGFSQLVVFGDSLSDTGNFFNALGKVFPPTPPFFDGRLSDGPLWLEYLAPELGLTQTTNLAFIGATTGRDNVASLTVGQNLGDLPGLQDEVDQFALTLAQAGLPQADPKALYVVWAGANDFLTLPTAPLAALNAVLDSVENVAQSVISLAGLGAQTIVVPNLPNLGRTPFAVARDLVAQGQIFSTTFNLLLQGTLGQLESELGVDLVQVDIYGLVESIAQRPSEFGFTNITQPLIAAAAVTPGVNPAEFAFMDDFHPTTAVHQLIAEAVERAVQPSAGYVRMPHERDYGFPDESKWMLPAGLPDYHHACV
jgi:phospholipase/lecithinase/hemolysin